MIVATCSADQRIKIFHKSAEDTWEPEAEWKVADGGMIWYSKLTIRLTTRPYYA